MIVTDVSIGWKTDMKFVSHEDISGDGRVDDLVRRGTTIELSGDTFEHLQAYNVIVDLVNIRWTAPNKTKTARKIWLRLNRTRKATLLKLQRSRHITLLSELLRGMAL